MKSLFFDSRTNPFYMNFYQDEAYKTLSFSDHKIECHEEIEFGWAMDWIEDHFLLSSSRLMEN